MSRKRTVEEEINEFINEWGPKKQISFLRDVIPLFELFDIEDEDDWVKNEVGEENVNSVRLLRTVYLISRIADHHAGALSSIKFRFSGLWKRMEHRRDFVEAAEICKGQAAECQTK